MHGLLSKIFEKKGIKNLNDLDREEKEVFDGYEKILNKKELTVEEIKRFLITQIAIIEGKWKDLNLEASRKSELIPYHTTYKMILDAISAPESERANLESYLQQLLK